MKLVFEPCIREDKELGFHIYVEGKEAYNSMPTDLHYVDLPAGYKQGPDFIQPIREDEMDGTFYFLIGEGYHRDKISAGPLRFVTREDVSVIQRRLEIRNERIRFFREKEDAEKEAARLERQKFLEEKRAHFASGFELEF